MSEQSADWTSDIISTDLERLEHLLPAQAVRGKHFFADLAVLSFAHQLLDYGRAALLIANSDVPSTAYPLVRAAFEALMDLVYLIKSPEYNLNGARAYVSARYAEVVGRGQASGTAANLRMPQWPANPPTIRDLLKKDAEFWDSIAPGNGELLYDALVLVKKDWARGRKHWRGFSRDELHDNVQRLLADSELGLIFRSVYQELAAKSHSRMRVDHIRIKATRIELTSRPVGPDDSLLTVLGGIIKTAPLILHPFFAARKQSEADPGDH